MLLKTTKLNISMVDSLISIVQVFVTMLTAQRTRIDALQFAPSLASLYILLKHEKFLLKIYMELTGEN